MEALLLAPARLILPAPDARQPTPIKTGVESGKFLFYWLPVYLYMGLIFYLSSQSRPPVPSIMLRWDKITHFFEYAVLGLLLIRALNKEYPGRSFLALKLTALAVSAIYAASDEFHQSFVPGRFSCLADWAVDSAGSSLGSFFIIKRKA